MVLDPTSFIYSKNVNHNFLLLPAVVACMRERNHKNYVYAGDSAADRWIPTFKTAKSCTIERNSFWCSSAPWNMQLNRLLIDSPVSPADLTNWKQHPNSELEKNRQWKAWKAWSHITRAPLSHCWMKNALATIWSDAEEAAQMIFFSLLIQRLAEVLLRGAACLCAVYYPDW